MFRVSKGLILHLGLVFTTLLASVV